MADAASTRRNPQFKDIGWHHFGRLLAVEFVGERNWRCLCSCGAEVVVHGNKLRTGHTQSCGCLQRELTRERSRVHGLAPRRGRELYNIWQAMIGRCTVPGYPGYENYGERGIEVCQQWLDPAKFMADMGPRPSPRHSLDRIDNDGPYEPGNTRWATDREQARNKRTNRNLSLDGETLCLTDWAERLGISVGALRKRLDNGWSIRRALTEPVHR